MRHALINLVPTEFMMGSPAGEAGRFTDELRHKVRLTKVLYMQTTEVTQRQWETVMGSNPSFYDLGDDYPVENITWHEAVEFCNRLSEREGMPPAYIITDNDILWDESSEGYRLPTEAEWEFAARASTPTAHYYGDLIVDPESCDLDSELNKIGSSLFGVGKRVAF